MTSASDGIDFRAEIERLRKEKNAVILAHYYQQAVIQDLADFVGDSLDLSRRAAETDAEMIVFCGVRFMGEVAKILSPEKTVVIPDMDAGCSLEEACPAGELARFRREHPDHLIVTYINSSVEAKALSDYVVTSSSALDILAAIDEDRPVLFAPDRNMGRWLNAQTGRQMDLWPGACVVHEEFSKKRLRALRERYPHAPVAAHPECRPGILKQADFVGSTSGILNFVLESPKNDFIIATECNIIHQLEMRAPEKTFIPAPVKKSAGGICAECPYMALNTLEKLWRALQDESPQILIEPDLRERALKPLQRMLEITAKKTDAS